MYMLINIPKETYEKLKNLPNFTSNMASQAVRDGIPLPRERDRHMTDMELMQVLGEVSDDCFYRSTCGGCKFDRNGECILKGTPADWDIETIKERTE